MGGGVAGHGIEVHVYSLLCWGMSVACHPGLDCPRGPRSQVLRPQTAGHRRARRLLAGGQLRLRHVRSQLVANQPASSQLINVHELLQQEVDGCLSYPLAFTGLECKP